MLHTLGESNLRKRQLQVTANDMPLRFKGSCKWLSRRLLRDAKLRG